MKFLTTKQLKELSDKQLEKLRCQIIDAEGDLEQYRIKVGLERLDRKYYKESKLRDQE